MAAVRNRRSSWTQKMEESLVELWQEHQCLFDVSDDQYHNGAEKEKRWTEIANSLQRPVEEVKTRAVSLRTQYSRLIKPKPGGSGNKPLTWRQKWLLRVMDFIKQYIVHRPCESALDVSFSDQDDTEHQDNLTDLLGQSAVKSPQSRPGTPSAGTASPPEWLNKEGSPAAADEAPSPVPSTASREVREESSARGVKRKRRSESDIEQQKLFVLKQMAAKFDADPVPDALTTFGNHVACELRQLQDPANLTKLKRDIINMIFDAQDAERSKSSPSSAPPALYTFQPIISSPLTTESQPTSLQTTFCDKNTRKKWRAEMTQSHASGGIFFSSKTDARNRRAIQVLCALDCNEKPRKRKKRTWVRQWIGISRQQGLSVLQRELEMHDKTGFRELLCMTAEEFDFLLGMVEHLITKQDTKLRLAISPRERLALTLRFLVTGESFRSLGFQYRIGTSTLSQIVMETCAAVYQVMKNDFLKTPSTEAEWRTIARDFEVKWQFPHCLGALDGKRINIQFPVKGGSLYHNYKGRSSVVITAAVDANYRFIYASVGTQGSVSDSGMFTHSDLCKAMDQSLLNFPLPEPLPNSDIVMPYMFVANDAYPLRHDLMKPYPIRKKDHSHRVLNYRLSRAHRVVENAFGILANRLRVFRCSLCLEPEKVVKLTMASFCIHNFLCERKSEAYIPSAFADWENADHKIFDGSWRSQGMGALQPVRRGKDHNPAVTAESQRDVLSDYFVSPAGHILWQEEHA